MQKNPEFAEKAIADWEVVQTTLFWDQFLKELNNLKNNASQHTAEDLDMEEVRRYQGEYRVLGRVLRLPATIIERLRKVGIPDAEMLGPNLK